MDGKTEVQREIGRGQNLSPDNLTAQSTLTVITLSLLPSMSIADFSNNSLGMSVKGRRGKLRKPPFQGGSDTFLTHKIAAEYTDHTDSFKPISSSEVFPDLCNPLVSSSLKSRAH